MKHFLSLFTVLLLFGSCCSLKSPMCKECRYFNKYIKKNWIYEKKTNKAYYLQSSDQVTGNIDLSYVTYCWKGLKVSELKKVLPSEVMVVGDVGDAGVVVITLHYKEQYDCWVNNVNCDKLSFEYPYDVFYRIVFPVKDENIIKSISYGEGSRLIFE